VYRHDGFEFKPDPIMTNSNILSSASGVFDVAKASGATWVTELYGELLVPVMNDLPMVKSLNLELGARWSSYNTAGDISTYKALTTWDIVDSVTIRGGYQLANRAPNVAELFQSPTTIVTIVPTFDACANITTAPYGNVASNPDRARVQALCSTLAGGVPIGDNFVGLGAFSSLALDQQIGNPNLESESATTWTIGTILRSPWQAAALSGLTATIDWYRIEINDAITGLNSATVYEQCFNGTGSSNPNYDANNEFCRLINRDNLFGFPAGVDGIYTNIGAIRTSGIDAQINWSADLADLGTSAPGKLLLNVALNYLNSYEIQTAAGAPFIDYADTTGNGTSGAQFKTKIYTTLGYSIGPVNTRLSWRHLPSLDSTVPGALPNESHNELDLSALWTVGDNLTVRAGVDNLTNEDPEIVGRIPGVNNAVGSTDPGFYDTLGRRFYVGMSAKF
jgi:iron complex outermembrane recepter protein